MVLLCFIFTFVLLILATCYTVCKYFQEEVVSYVNSLLLDLGEIL